jgi:hypothetical protein
MKVIKTQLAIWINDFLWWRGGMRFGFRRQDPWWARWLTQIKQSKTDWLPHP